MDNVVTLTNTKEQTLDFDVTVNGVDSQDMQCRFVIETSLGEMGFTAHRTDSTSKWEVKIPALPHLERTGHNFRVDVIVDGYYFEAMRGLVNVVGPVDLYISEPRNVSMGTTVPEPKVSEPVPHNHIAPVVKDPVPLVVHTEEEKNNQKDDRIAEIARSLIRAHKNRSLEIREDKKSDEGKPLFKKKAAKKKVVAKKKSKAEPIAEASKLVDKTSKPKKPGEASLFKKVASKKSNPKVESQKDIAVVAVLEGLQKDEKKPEPKQSSIIHKGKVVEG